VLDVPMDPQILKTVGQVAGIGGVALGVFLLLFRDLIRKNIFPKLPAAEAYRLLRLITGAVWSVAIAGIVAWVYVSTRPTTVPGPSATMGGSGNANAGKQIIHGDLNIGIPASSNPHIVILDFVINQEGPEEKNNMGGTTLARAARFTVHNDGESSAVDCRAEWQPLTGETSTASPYFGLAPKQSREFTLTGYIASARIIDSTAKVNGTSTVRVECKNNIKSDDLERQVDYDKKGLTY
jgi:hypothetical protein